MAETKEKIYFSGDVQQGTYITLKEAAELTNYSPDYIGQLIRAGKIEGRQVYTNISWVTTEKAIRSYMETKGKESSLDEGVLLARRVSQSVRYTLYAVIAVLLGMLLVMLYVFAVGVDRAVTDSYIEGFDPHQYGF